jgi:hypothetical protein
MKRVTGHGLALQGDGLGRARSRIKAAGFESVTAYIESFPCASLLEIADKLNESDSDSDPLPISADHLARLWRDEARRGGPTAIERMARRALVGELHRHLPTGWPATLTEEASFPLTSAEVTWSSIIGRDLKTRAVAVFEALSAARPAANWLPEDANDSVVAAAFKHWDDLELAKQ